MESALQALNVPVLLVIVRGMRRWSLFVECVTDEVRTMTIFGAGVLVVTEIMAPLTAEAGAADRIGREAGLPSALRR